MLHAHDCRRRMLALRSLSGMGSRIMRLGLIGASLCLGVGLGCPAHAAEIEGLKIDDRVYIAQGLPELALNGVGVRRKFVVLKMYVAALYLAQKKTASDEVLSDTGPKRVAMHILQDEITAEQLIAAL